MEQETSSRMAVIADTGADMAISKGARSLLIRRFHAFCAPSSEAAEQGTGPTCGQPSRLFGHFNTCT